MARVGAAEPTAGVESAEVAVTSLVVVERAVLEAVRREALVARERAVQPAPPSGEMADPRVALDLLAEAAVTAPEAPMLLSIDPR